MIKTTAVILMRKTMSKKPPKMGSLELPGSARAKAQVKDTSIIIIVARYAHSKGVAPLHIAENPG
jgi:hypothetical protein